MINWDATAFFSRLTASNRHAVNEGYVFHRVTSLQGFHDALSSALSSRSIVAVCDTSEGSTSLDNSPHTRRVKTVFMARRHRLDDLRARDAAMDDMRELFRQFMSVLVQEKAQLEEHCIYIDQRITFKEIDRYFFNGAACAVFQVAVNTYTDLRYNPEEWITPPISL